MRAGDSTDGTFLRGFLGATGTGGFAGGRERLAGQILELAIYNRELSAEEIARADAADSKGDQSTSDGKVETRKTPDKNVIAQYEFAEGSGKVIHNSAGPAPDLYIPGTFRILHKPFLMPPWQEHPDKVTLRDIVINIGGFVPFGFSVSSPVCGVIESGGAR